MLYLIRDSRAWQSKYTGSNIINLCGEAYRAVASVFVLVSFLYIVIVCIIAHFPRAETGSACTLRLVLCHRKHFALLVLFGCTALLLAAVFCVCCVYGTAVLDGQEKGT